MMSKSIQSDLFNSEFDILPICPISLSSVSLSLSLYPHPSAFIFQFRGTLTLITVPKNHKPVSHLSTSSNSRTWSIFFNFFFFFISTVGHWQERIYHFGRRERHSLLFKILGFLCFLWPKVITPTSQPDPLSLISKHSSPSSFDFVISKVLKMESLRLLATLPQLSPMVNPYAYLGQAMQAIVFPIVPASDPVYGILILFAVVYVIIFCLSVSIVVIPFTRDERFQHKHLWLWKKEHIPQSQSHVFLHSTDHLSYLSWAFLPSPNRSLDLSSPSLIHLFYSSFFWSVYRSSNLFLLHSQPRHGCRDLSNICKFVSWDVHCLELHELSIKRLLSA